MRPGDAVRSASRSLSEASLKLQVASALKNSASKEIAPVLTLLQQVMSLPASPKKNDLLRGVAGLVQRILLADQSARVGKLTESMDRANTRKRERLARLRKSRDAGRQHLFIDLGPHGITASVHGVDGKTLKSYSGPKDDFLRLAGFLIEVDPSFKLLEEVTSFVRS